MRKVVLLAAAGGALVLSVAGAIVATRANGVAGPVDRARWLWKRPAAIRACVAGALDATPGEKKDVAEKYCGCVFDTVQARWSPSEFGARHPQIQKELTADGTLDRCRGQAGVVIKSPRYEDGKTELTPTADGQAK